MLLDRMYALWETIFWEWENGNILDGTGQLPMGKVTSIGKSTFNCLVRVCEF